MLFFEMTTLRVEKYTIRNSGLLYGHPNKLIKVIGYETKNCETAASDQTAIAVHQMLIKLSRKLIFKLFFAFSTIIVTMKSANRIILLKSEKH